MTTHTAPATRRGLAPNRPEHADVVRPVPGADPRFAVKRVLVDYAYAAHGNLHNPTPRYDWWLLLDGKPVDRDSRRGPLVEAARKPCAVDLYAA